MLRPLAFFAPIAAFAALAVLVACSSDHDLLAKTEPGSTTSGTGGDGGAGPTTSAGAGGSGGIEEPPGPTMLTVVNGIADQDAIRLCFVPYPDGPGSEMPWPTSLAFAAGAAVDPTEVVPDGSDVEVLVVGGSLGSASGKTCAQLVGATPPGVVVRSLAVVPAAAFAEPKSLLFVPVGCAGGAGHTHDAQAFVCGPRYSEASPDPGLVAGFMSRIGGPNALPLQLVHASRGLETAEARIKPGIEGAMAQIVADPWGHGAIAPFPPYLALSSENLGNPPDAALEVASLMNGQVLSTVPWADAFALGTVPIGDIADGVGLTFVAVGAAPSIGEGPWWHAFTWTVVASDP